MREHTVTGGWPDDVDKVITCIDCGGRAHLLGFWTDEDPPGPGDIVAYRCQDCRDRWDLVVPEAPENSDDKN